MAVNHMKQNSTLSAYAEPMHYDLKELLVGYDFSAAADSALKYAVMLSTRFGSFIHLIGVQSPADYAGAVEAGPVAMEMSQRDLQFGLQEIQESLRAKGIWTDSVRRIGNISDTIEGAILEHTPDLLLLGAYGYGPIDRPRLGAFITDSSLPGPRCRTKRPPLRPRGAFYRADPLSCDLIRHD
jgi:nucleotide-binding universal stress UspA family protein